MKARANPPVHDKSFDGLIEALGLASQQAMQDMLEKIQSKTGDGLAQSWQTLTSQIAQNPELWADLQNRYYQQQIVLWMNMLGTASAVPESSPPLQDKRFAAPEWDKYPMFQYIKQSYLNTSQLLMEAVEKADLDSKERKKLQFFTKQYLDAISPTNYAATNPEVLKLALETEGESIATGMKQWLADVEKGRISMTDEEAFEVGRNVGVSEGEVIFQTPLIQLIQYKPLTKTVYERPILMVPPCINKYYIMDLQPDNSLVRFSVEQGHTVFLISWRNVPESMGNLVWDDYLDAVIEAIDVVGKITRQKKINALGFCVGGTILSSALAVLRARKQDKVASMTLMTALLEFSQVGDISVYVNREFVEKKEKQYAKGGLLPGAELASAFSSLRANDLVWNYVVNNYLKGKMPDAFDLLYWNSDSTNLPGPMFAYYVKNTYLENNLVKQNRLTMCGEKIDLGSINLPTLAFAAKEDHIVPWHAAYESAKYISGKVEFVLGASGHIAGSINSAKKNKRNYWSSSKFPDDAEKWLAGAQSHEGSWWTHWAKWLKPHGGKQVAARVKLGSAEFKMIEPAPGSYVKERC
ncbi:MAG: class I poly(R)-hydroxyalkanoic acid synthase [Burkholderiales bacterium]